MTAEGRLKLKPCPFCGNKARIENHNLGDGEIETIISCDECNCAIVGEFEDAAIREWNSAYCWEQIQELTERNENLEKENRELKVDLMVKFTLHEIEKDVEGLENDRNALQLHAEAMFKLLKKLDDTGKLSYGAIVVLESYLNYQRSKSTRSEGGGR